MLTGNTGSILLRLPRDKKNPQEQPSLHSFTKYLTDSQRRLKVLKWQHSPRKP